MADDACPTRTRDLNHESSGSPSPSEALSGREIALTHPRLRQGGSEARALWTIQGLRRYTTPTLLTCGSVPPLEKLNRRYGTDLTSGDFRVRSCPAWAQLIGSIGAAVRGALFQRYVFHVEADYDLLVSTYNFTHCSIPAVQFVADFSWDEELRRRFDPVPRSGLRGLAHHSATRPFYRAFVRSLAGGDTPRYDKPHYTTVANSEWTAEMLSRRHGVRSRVVPPPVPGQFPAVPFDERKKRFVSIGRISPEKRIERVIDIVSKLRSRGLDVGLDIIGPLTEDNYSREIAEQVNRSGSWVRLLGGMWGDEKREALPEYRYALHGKEGEAFGISVAEYMKAGCVPFVPDVGGPATLVGDDSLTFGSVNEAVEKIEAVLADENRGRRLHEEVSMRASRFSAAHFVDEMRQLVVAAAPDSDE